MYFCIVQYWYDHDGSKHIHTITGPFQTELLANLYIDTKVHKLDRSDCQVRSLNNP